MARMPRGGSTFSALYEKHGTLDSLIARLGLRPLSEAEDEILRDVLGTAIGKFRQQTDVQSKEDVLGRLAEIAKGCELASDTLNALNTGLHEALDIEVAHVIARVAAQDPSYRSLQEAQSFLIDFARQAGAVAAATKVTIAQLKNAKRKGGRDALDWYHDFTEAIVQLCEWNDIRPTINTDRQSYLPEGRFLKVAAELEQILYPKMRSPNKVARAQRLKRGLRWLKAPAGTKP